MSLQYWKKYNGSRQLDVVTARTRWSVRLGRPEWVSFSERYQGEHGIPRRYWYTFGHRFTLIRRRGSEA